MYFRLSGIQWVHFRRNRLRSGERLCSGNSLFPGEERANAVVSVRGDVTMSPVLQVMDTGVAIIPPVTD